MSISYRLSLNVTQVKTTTSIQSIHEVCISSVTTTHLYSVLLWIIQLVASCLMSLHMKTVLYTDRPTTALAQRDYYTSKLVAQNAAIGVFVKHIRTDKPASLEYKVNAKYGDLRSHFWSVQRPARVISHSISEFFRRLPEAHRNAVVAVGFTSVLPLAKHALCWECFVAPATVPLKKFLLLIRSQY